MRNIILLSAFILLLMTSCATYRNGQTPDDVYFAAEPENYVHEEYDLERREEFNNGGRRVRIIDNNQPNTLFNRSFCHDPASMIILNNQCFCAVNGNLIPFIPRTALPSSPVRSSTVSALGNTTLTEQPVRAGKYFVNPKPSNGSSIFKGGSNQNQTRYSNTTDNNNSGSRYFQSNSSPSSSYGNSSSGGRSGRRN